MSPVREATGRRWYVILARHGTREHDDFRSERDDRLTAKGMAEVRSAAVALAEHMRLQPTSQPIRVGEIWHGRYAHTVQTAEQFGWALDRDDATGRTSGAGAQCHERADLDPTYFWPLGQDGATNIVTEIREKLETYRTSARASGTVDKNAILIVGHQPQLGWIGEALLDGGLPVWRAEVACIAVHDHWLDDHSVQFPANRRLLRTLPRPIGDEIAEHFGWGSRLAWTIEPSNDGLIDELRAKIRSKMDVAKVLGGFVFATLALFLDPNRIKVLLDNPIMVTLLGTEVNVRYNAALISALLFIVAAILYMAMLVAYDTLLMPTRFWAERSVASRPSWLVARPPSSSSYVLYQNMVRVWIWMFVPATICVVTGFLFLAGAALGPGRFMNWSPEASALALFILLAAGIRGFLAYFRRFRPRLGVED